MKVKVKTPITPTTIDILEKLVRFARDNRIYWGDEDGIGRRY